jgi:hypothetical protein
MKENRSIRVPESVLRNAVACIARAESVGAFGGCAAPGIGAATLAALIKCQGSGATDFDRTGRLYPKIDLFYRDGAQWRYARTTEQWATVRDAVQSFADSYFGGRICNENGVKIVRGARA